jgi:hypothetical protein
LTAFNNSMRFYGTSRNAARAVVKKMAIWPSSRSHSATADIALTAHRGPD